jgi:hypothetical protein
VYQLAHNVTIADSGLNQSASLATNGFLPNQLNEQIKVFSRPVTAVFLGE